MVTSIILRESDNIGKGIGMSDSKLASCMGHYSGPQEKALKRYNGKNSFERQTEEQLGFPLRDTGKDLSSCWLV